LALQPAEAGTGTLIFDITTKGFKDRIIIDSVVVYPDIKIAQANIPEEPADPNEISFLKEQAWKIEFATVPVKFQAFNDVIHTSGQVQAAPGDEVTIAAKSDGIVRFINKNNLQGTPVSAGQALFTVSGSGIAGSSNIDAAVQAARAEFQKARADYERAQELVKDQLISQREYQEIQLRYRTSQAQLNNLSSSYGSGGKTLTSPIPGFITNVAVTEGQFVSMGQPIATVSQNKRLVLRAEVSQKDFGKVRGIQSANFTTPDNRTFSTAALNGRLISFAKATGNSLMLPVFFEINNTGDIVPGTVVDVYLHSGVILDALVIPITALIEEQGKFYLYVQTGGESFEKREVQLGASDGINVQVLEGIRKDERVVVKGAYQIKLAAMSGTMPAHGHEH
jgi:RND family efflux transporter MFP subunit